MTTTTASFADQYKAELLKTIDSIDTGKVDQAIEWFKEARQNNRHIFTCGNGGSAATAPISQPIW